jgi:hypothetical protein
MRLGEARAQLDGAAMARRRVLVFLPLVMRDADIAQRLGILGIERDRFLPVLERQIGPPGEAVHLAEIGLEERHLRREFDRPLHMLDRLGELAALMEDDAEEMDRRRLYRFRGEELLEQRLGLIEPTGAAMLLDKLVDLRNRHELPRVFAADRLVHCLSYSGIGAPLHPAPGSAACLTS